MSIPEITRRFPPAALIIFLYSPTRVDSPAQEPPRFEITTEEKFDAASIPAYPGRHQAIYEHIDQNLERHLQHIQRWLRQPSVSAQDIGIQEMAEMVRDDVKALGFQETEIVSPPRVIPGSGAITTWARKRR